MIRLGNINDLETIVNYNYNLAKESEDLDLNISSLTKGVKAALLDNSKGIYFVYEKDNKVIGQLMITKEWSDWRNGCFFWIQSVYVHKDYRRQGIFKQLFEYVKSLAKADTTVCGVRLYVEKENERAKDTYKILGMEETNYLLYEIERESL